MDYNRLRRFMECLRDCDNIECDDCWLMREYCDGRRTCPESDAAVDILNMLDKDRPDLKHGDHVSWTSTDADAGDVLYGHYLSSNDNGYSSVKVRDSDGHLYIRPVKSSLLSKVDSSKRTPKFKVGDYVSCPGDVNGCVVSVSDVSNGYDEIVGIKTNAGATVTLMAINVKKIERPVMNGKVKCIFNNTNFSGSDWTVGKIYEVKNGVIQDDTGFYWSNRNKLYHNVDELNTHMRHGIRTSARFEEYKEEPKPWNAKVKCIWNKRGLYTSVWTVGKIYEVKDGKIVDDSGFRWNGCFGRPCDSLGTLNSFMEIGTGSAARFEEIEEDPKKYNGRIVCTECKGHTISCAPWFTVGKIYKVENGILTDEQGHTWGNKLIGGRSGFKSFEELKASLGSDFNLVKFIEIKE